MYFYLCAFRMRSPLPHKWSMFPKHSAHILFGPRKKYKMVNLLLVFSPMNLIILVVVPGRAAELGQALELTLD
jgi:hypothetical protein